MGDPSTPLTEAPCGCRFGTVGDAFVFQPCSLTCDLLAYVKRETAAQGKTVTTLDLR